MSPLWLMDYGSDSNYVIDEDAQPFGQPFWYQAYLPNHDVTDYYFFYVKKNQKCLMFPILLVCFLLVELGNKYGF